MTPVLERLPILIVDPYSRCNCRCRMCDIWKKTETDEISRDMLERNLASLEAFGIEWVVLSGGEPLMHPDLFGLCAALKARGVRVTLLTTGLLLGRHAGAVAAHVDDVIVSLDGPRNVHDAIRRVEGAFDTLAASVRGVREVRPDFLMAARCTVQRANHTHLRAAVRAAHGLGFGSISFLAADVRSTAFNRPGGWPLSRQEEIALSREELSALETEIEELIAEGECGAFIAESPEKLRRIVHHFRSHIGLAAAVAPQCNAPWVSVVVEADGTVRPCFFHPPIGKVGPGRTIADVLNGPEAVAFRSSLDVAGNPICRNCVCSLNLPLPQVG
jgi:MoaA/NifB/PqqE/SkfB family radical SAM enzyme